MPPFSLILGLAALAIFIVYYIYHNGSHQTYLLFVVYAFPLMELKLVPFAFGNLQVFHLVTLLAVLVNPKPLGQRLKQINGGLALFGLLMVTLVLSSTASDYPLQSLLGLIAVVTPFAFAAVLWQQASTDTEFIPRFVSGLKTASIIGLSFVLIQMIAGPDFSFYESLNQNVFDEDRIRYPGFFSDSQLNGIFFAMTSLFWLINFKNPAKISTRQMFMYSVMLGGVLLSGSRSPMIGAAAAIVFLLIFLRGNARTRMARYTVFASAFVLFAYTTTDAFSRFRNMDESLEFRQNIWQGAYAIFEKQPALGIGMNNYKDYVISKAHQQSILLEDNEILYLDSPENGYLKFLVEWGLIASLLMTIILLRPLMQFVSSYFRGYDVRIAAIMAAIMISWFVCNMSVHTLSDPRIVILLATAMVFTALFAKKNINIHGAA